MPELKLTADEKEYLRARRNTRLVELFHCVQFGHKFVNLPSGELVCAHCEFSYDWLKKKGLVGLDA